MKINATTNLKTQRTANVATMPYLLGGQGQAAERLPLPEVTYVDWAEWERVALLARAGIDLGVSRQIAR